MWRDNGKLRHGPLYTFMRTSRSRFKYAMRKCKNNEKQLRADAVATSLSSCNFKEFWKEVCVMNNKSMPLSNTVNGVTGMDKIAKMWAQHFKQLLNGVKAEPKKEDVLNSVQHVPFNENMIVSPLEIYEICWNNLGKGKSTGIDSISSEHIQFASQIIYVLLSMCITAMFVHGHMPPEMLRVLLVPLIKNKCGMVTDKDNYRPIALASVVSKIVEHLILKRCGDALQSSDSQFGFKKEHSTDLCIFLLKETIRYYMSQGSPVFVCFLDAKKAFDRVNHWKLFKKMIDRNVPLFIVRLLMMWYTNQLFCVRWGSVTSTFFTVTNGVRQGGVLSPHLYNLYMNDLLVQLKEAGVGCKLHGTVANNFSYADDMCIASPSVGGLRRLIYICHSYALDHDIIYNTNKSECMYFVPRARRELTFPGVSLDGTLLKVVNQFTYLGHILAPNLCDDLDIKRQYRALCVRANMLIRKFSYCSHDVKCILFRSYCANMYTSQLWCNFTQGAMKSLNICYNNSLRWLLGKRRSCSASEMFVVNSVPTFATMMRKYIFSFRERISKSGNTLIAFILKSDWKHRSPLYQRWNNLLYIV
jgi:hypothetical protein